MVFLSQVVPAASVKLRELTRHRERIGKTYETVTVLRDAEQKTSRADQVQILYEGLKSLRFSNSPAHPNIANLDNMLERLKCGDASVSQAVLDMWHAKLMDEIEKGRKRADYAWLFGRVLSQWLDEASKSSDKIDLSGSDEGDAEVAELAADGGDLESFLGSLKDLATPVPEGTFDISVVDEVFAGMGSELAKLKASISDFCKPSDKPQPLTATFRVTPEELKSAATVLLRQCLLDHRETAFLRDILASEDLVKEYCGCATILVDGFDEWEWDAKSAKELRVETGKNGKTRAFVHVDVLNALVLQILGIRWSVHLNGALNTFWSALVTSITPSTSSYPNYDSVAYHRRQRRELIFLAALPNSTDAAAQEARRYQSVDAGDDTEGQGGAKARLLEYMAAEVRLGKHAGAPTGRTVVVASDIKNFGPSLPHPLLMKFLETIGVPDRWLSFFRRFLSPTVLIGTPAAPHVVARGVPQSFDLSMLVSELVLFGLDVAVLRATKGAVHLARQHDDIYLWARSDDEALKAWTALTEYLRRCGLEVNSEKSGAVGVPGVRADQQPALPSALPIGPVRWGGLTLQESGEWHLDETVIAAELDGLEKDVARAAGSALGTVNAYNARVTRIQAIARTSVALGVELVEESLKVQSRARAGAGSGEGIVRLVQRMIKETLLKGTAMETEEVPECWIYWPVLAGGLGLKNPAITLTAARAGLLSDKRAKDTSDIASVAEEFFNRTPNAGGDESDSDSDDDKGWEDATNSIGSAYGSLFDAIEPEVPLDTPRQTALTTEFKKFDSDDTLSTPYWNWVLATYGEQMEHVFGTVGLASADVVPAALVKHLKQASE
ncbi:hypothetical protein M427DRAFT_56692 [Gonapodya prolifera JEL478]|uniref:Reverse transcriptase domain-containing protein n=1 Tax=Gonapodya prolifera (strain JEL478) TaxID=1344416 RepID=A0A139AFM3_GONPJ|nr:hypothetical protein M427DRAFT_56692 [Gonapodya prolifera JEL478]|eukprot:KXS15622.1 hypothetical protein M427DRAFT_56692 [Gonapodya prolifera JEL478]